MALLTTAISATLTAYSFAKKVYAAGKEYAGIAEKASLLQRDLELALRLIRNRSLPLAGNAALLADFRIALIEIRDFLAKIMLAGGISTTRRFFQRIKQAAGRSAWLGEFPSHYAKLDQAIHDLNLKLLIMQRSVAYLIPPTDGRFIEPKSRCLIQWLFGTLGPLAGARDALWPAPVGPPFMLVTPTDLATLAPFRVRCFGRGSKLELRYGPHDASFTALDQQSFSILTYCTGAQGRAPEQSAEAAGPPIPGEFDQDEAQQATAGIDSGMACADFVLAALPGLLADLGWIKYLVWNGENQADLCLLSGEDSPSGTTHSRPRPPASSLPGSEPSAQPLLRLPKSLKRASLHAFDMQAHLTGCGSYRDLFTDQVQSKYIVAPLWACSVFQDGETLASQGDYESANRVAAVFGRGPSDWLGSLLADPHSHWPSLGDPDTKDESKLATTEDVAAIGQTYSTAGEVVRGQGEWRASSRWVWSALTGLQLIRLVRDLHGLDRTSTLGGAEAEGLCLTCFGALHPMNVVCQPKQVVDPSRPNLHYQVHRLLLSSFCMDPFAILLYRPSPGFSKSLGPPVGSPGEGESFGADAGPDEDLEAWRAMDEYAVCLLLIESVLQRPYLVFFCITLSAEEVNRCVQPSVRGTEGLIATLVKTSAGCDRVY